MGVYRYTRWDGTEPFELDKDELMDELGRYMMSYGDLSYALWKMQRDGLQSGGRRFPSLQDMVQRLKQRRQSQLDKYRLGSVMDDIKNRLDNVLKTERAGIQRRLDEARQKAKEGEQGPLPAEMQKRLLKVVEDMAGRNTKKLDALPPDVGGRLKELTKYDFMDEDARRQFQELMDMLKKHAMESYSRDLMQNLKNLDPNTLNDVRRMLQALNRMLEQRRRGQEPDFEQFMQQYGQYFGPNPPKNLDELMEQLQRQIAQAQSLLESMSPEDRESLDKLLRSMLDERLQDELARLADNLEALHPSEGMKRQYPFSGDESISYSEALKLMENLQKMDRLEGQLKESQYSRSLEEIDRQLAREVLGDDSAKQLEALNDIAKVLEEAGYIKRQGDKYELTPRGMRRIGQKALADIFAQLRRDRTGEHISEAKGASPERLEDTKKYEFGDPLWLHLQKTFTNALRRELAVPIKLTTDDFEVFTTEELTRSATVLMIDLSLSMPMRGNFEAAKQVALALDGLIRTKFPNDRLHIVGFSSYARVLKKEELYYLGWDQFDPYTNMQHGFHLARKLLDKERSTNKQIVLVSDGEPTAHVENGEVYFQYPPSARTLQLTMREVRRCTQKGIVINTFMLERSPFMSAFVVQMAKMNKGRVLFTGADRLGQYMLVDYISSKRKMVR